MKIIRTTLSDVSEIHMSQNGRVKQAAERAHQKNRTRRSRAYQKVNQSISHQASTRSLV